ncbi:MAG: SpoIIE family protein phosphatase [Xanthobacteraceae bacterium]
MTKDADGSISILARSNPVLAPLAPATIANLIQTGEIIKLRPGDILIRQGDSSDCAYLVLEGELEIRVDTTYGEVPLARVSAGALIGEIGVFAQLPRTATIRAESAARVLRLDRTHLLGASDTDPELSRSIIGRLGGQIANFNNAIGLYTNAVSALERDDFDLSILDELRKPVPELVDFAQSFRRMAEQIVRQRRQQAEMASAAAIQRAMLPSGLPTSLIEGRFDIHIQIKPAREVGGDFYDIIPLDENRIAITVGDVCGKGIPAALFMAVTQTVMRVVVRSGEELGAKIAAANERLVAGNEQMMFATMFCGVLDVRSGTLTYCNCGHNPPLVVRRAGGPYERLPAGNPPLGIMDTLVCVPKSIELAPGDLLFLYTDGVTEAEDPQAAQFGMERLQKAISEVAECSASKLVENVMARVAEFAKGAPQSDDIICAAVVRTGKPLNSAWSTWKQRFAKWRRA